MIAAYDEGDSPIRVVLADANILYSRVLRDFLLYAATQSLIEVRWSPEILTEVVEHLIENVPGFDAEAGRRLTTAMNAAFPDAEVEPDDEARAAIAHVVLPDDEDRHVLAAAVAVHADVLCTDNLKDFPAEVMTEFDVSLLSADALLTLLVADSPGTMLTVHRLAMMSLPGATDDSTVAALGRAGAIDAAALLKELLDG